MKLSSRLADINLDFRGAAGNARRILDEGAMLIKYTCKDMGLNCPFSIKGSSLEEVTAKALEHVRQMHAGEFNSIRSPAEIAQMELALSRSTKVVKD